MEDRERTRRKVDPDIIVSSNMGMKTVTMRSCEECGEEFCHLDCLKFEYDDNMRIVEKDLGPTESRKVVKKTKKKTDKKAKKSLIEVVLSPRR